MTDGSKELSVEKGVMEVIIIGAGLGGLATALSCVQNGLKVQVFEKTPEILPIGAGIQIPPNGVRALRYLGVDDKVQSSGAVAVQAGNLRSYKDGRNLLRRAGGEAYVRDYGAPWYVIHRADYHRFLYDETIRRGVRTHLGVEIESVDFTIDQASVTTKSGQKFYGDVVVGADGLWSKTRSLLLQHDASPMATGDMAYRATFTVEQLQSLNNEKLNALIKTPETNVWMGPNSHAVLYSVKGGSVYNLVLVCPDTLPPGFSTIQGDVKEMQSAFSGWDPMLTDVLGLVSHVLKWRLCHNDELLRWTKGNVVIIGDASHPTLPYQAQGAAMAVEDGAILGHLLGRLGKSASSGQIPEKLSIPHILKMFEQLRKHRTTVNVRGAINNQRLFHMPDGPGRDERDRILGQTNWETQTPTVFSWNNLEYQRNMLSFDFIADADCAFDKFVQGEVARL
ncbi:putative salicylate hydroxylase [Rhizodiscina lignyota]|uniref:Salicylate hydroxylase n=1 Tax=Rhizodiscina lignyota TaxID=1504668 RepID=A0A9P4IKR3_9PEZI|nr:putative salicylate hydroxylase [Rhizodiscina lignyota]